MNYYKIFTIMILSAVLLGGAASQIDTSTGTNQTWVEQTSTNLAYTGLTATVTVTIKNKANTVQYFKISQAYKGSLSNGSSGGENATEGSGDNTIRWDIVSSSPKAVTMATQSYNASTDYGWAIGAGKTKTVTFKVRARGHMGSEPSWISPENADSGFYWPLNTELGLDTSWFQPNELETLNPHLDIRKWKATFRFTVNNMRTDKTVYGIVRTPITPINSRLVASSPKAFIDRDTVLDGYCAAWNVKLPADTAKSFSCTYTWPYTRSGSSNTATASSGTIDTEPVASSKTVPTQSTGVPYLFLIIAGIVTACGAGLGFMKFKPKK